MQVLDLDRAKAIYTTKLEFDQEEAAPEAGPYSHEEHYRRTADSYEEISELEQAYTHAEHYEDDLRATLLESDSDSGGEVYFEGNCAFRRGTIVGYSSDCDWS